jgi:alpha/beta superfamily hydrolase
MKNFRTEFNGSLGDKLSAILSLPDSGDTKSYAIFAHCFTCNKSYKIINSVSRVLTERGIAVFRFDFTGLGESKGDFSRTDFRTNVMDMLLAAEYLRHNYAPPKLLIGHSLGGATAIAAASEIAGIKGIVTIASPPSLTHLKDSLENFMQIDPTSGGRQATIGGEHYTLSQKLLDSLKPDVLENKVKELNLPYLIVQGTKDYSVTTKEAETLFKLANQPKSFVTINNGGHLMPDRTSSEYVAKIIASWFSLYEID